MLIQEWPSYGTYNYDQRNMCKSIPRIMGTVEYCSYHDKIMEKQTSKTELFWLHATHNQQRRNEKKMTDAMCEAKIALSYSLPKIHLGD